MALVEIVQNRFPARSQRGGVGDAAKLRGFSPANDPGQTHETQRRLQAHVERSVFVSGQGVEIIEPGFGQDHAGPGRARDAAHLIISVEQHRLGDRSSFLKARFGFGACAFGARIRRQRDAERRNKRDQSGRGR